MKKLLALLFFLLFHVHIAYSQEAMPGDVIVVLRAPSGFNAMSAQSAGGIESLQAVRSFAESLNANVVKTYDSLSQSNGNIFMLIHSDTKDEQQLLREIKSRPDVIAASLNHIYTLNLPETPNDPEYYRLWGMDAINAPQAWTYGTGSDDVYVAVIDSGVDYNHPDLRANFSHEYSRNFLGYSGTNYDPSAYYDEDGHGTHVAGTIAGIGNNALGVAGVNWRAKVFSLRILDANGRGQTAGMIAAFNYISELLAKDSHLNIAALNFSVGTYGTTTPEALIAGNDPLWLALKTISDTDRTVICVAAGNENNDIGRPTPSTTESWLKGSYAYLGSYMKIDNMIVVATVTQRLEKAYFSNYSKKYVDIAAPGMNIFSTIPVTFSNDKGYAVLPTVYPYDLMSGTSMAAPHVTGSVALLKSIFPNATASQLKATILGGANGYYPHDDSTSAHGMLDLTGAINFMAGIMSSDIPPQISDSNPSAGVVGQRYKSEFYASGTQPLTWTLDGALPLGLTFDNGKISGTPKESGTFPFTVAASNDYGVSSLVMTLVISDSIAPVIDESTMSYETLASSDCVVTLMTDSGTWPMIWSITSSDVPSDFNMRITADSGVLRFMPTRAGTFTFTVNVSNDAGNDSATFTLKVGEAKAPEILYSSQTPLNSATPGRPYKSYRITAGGQTYTESINSTINARGTRPISWDISGLPEGLSFALNDPRYDSTTSTITITGRPIESGDFTLRVVAANSVGTSSMDIPFTVDDTEPSFIEDVIAAFSKSGLEIDTEFSQPLPIKGSAPMTFTISGDIPEGTHMRYDDSTPIFYGNPTKTGHYTFSIIAENSCGKDEFAFDLNVIEPSAITTNILPEAVKGVSYDAKITLRSDVNMTWAITADASLNLKISQSGDISGLPTKEGLFYVTVKASSPDVSADFCEASDCVSVYVPCDADTTATSAN